MRDYKHSNENNTFYLSCDSHRIIFDSFAEAHQYKLALGLGTFPDPEKEPKNYCVIPQPDNNVLKTYRVIIKRDTKSEEWADEACCHSGCPTCPWSK